MAYPTMTVPSGMVINENGTGRTDRHTDRRTDKRTHRSTYRGGAQLKRGKSKV